MARFSEYDEQTGERVEGWIGEACCPVCGCPMLAKYSLDGELLEVIGRCPDCRDEEARA